MKHLVKYGSRTYCGARNAIAATLEDCDCQTCLGAVAAERERQQSKARATAALLADLPKYQPTALQMRLILAWCRGEPVQKIAFDLGMAESTVYVHVHRLRDLGYDVPRRRDLPPADANGVIVPASLVPDDNPRTEAQRFMQCAARNVDLRCHRTGYYFRDGFLVCRQHAKNQKYVVHASAQPVLGERPQPRTRFADCGGYWKDPEA